MYISLSFKEPLKAEFLKRNLTLTHDSYELVDNDLMSEGINRLFGVITKGYEVYTPPLLL